MDYLGLICFCISFSWIPLALVWSLILAIIDYITKQ